ncbi:hypothetical protein JAAARDRAFT_128691 [Jaapia argillacea MUCL 33604]|uniref:Succinate dehydrogenase assembly factor 2, mitochondrial n=1 Tax=Jaapia argillacea MUCL 33604 TaxID=933084 RepID=A0A067PVD6_9AGAM|nr:hypothetical protein JAAARDRAFT_128691 [Jaapia argillacea MUCL 33604]
MLALNARRFARPTFIRCLSTTRPVRGDPWVLPNTPEHIAQTEAASQSQSTQSVIPPLPRPNEKADTLRARLLYQVRKRGTLETDLLLSTFATKDKLASMEETELKEFDKLLDEPDWDIYYWSTGKRTPPERWASSSILGKLRVHARNEGKEVRRMPDL